MARVAKAIKTTKTATKVGKPGRPPNVSAATQVNAPKTGAAKRSAAVAAPIEKRNPGRPAKTAIAAPRNRQGQQRRLHGNQQRHQCRRSARTNYGFRPRSWSNS